MEQSPSNMPVMESKPGVAGWFSVWMKAVSKPSEQAFFEITESPEAKMQTAFIWVFIGATIVALVSALVQGVSAMLGVAPTLPPIPGLEEYIDPSTLQQTGSPVMTLVIGLCAAPFAGLISIPFFALGVAIVQWVAKLFKGEGSFEKLAYAYAAITLPVSLVSAVLTLFSAIPYVGACFGFISIGVSIYSVVLQVYAVKAVNRFPTFGPAVGSVLIPGAVIFLVFCVCMAVITFAMGAALGGQGFAP
jgi:hypothetical protein